VGLLSLLGIGDDALKVYSRAYVTIDGSLLSEEASISLEKKSGMAPITTLGAGFAGMSLGSAICEVVIESAVPSTDFEFSPDLFLRKGETVEVGIIMADRQSVFKGFITEATYSHSVNKEALLHMKLMCRFAEFE
jgi:hypothetical protein